MAPVLGCGVASKSFSRPFCVTMSAAVAMLVVVPAPTFGTTHWIVTEDGRIQQQVGRFFLREGGGSASVFGLHLVPHLRFAVVGRRWQSRDRALPWCFPIGGLTAEHETPARFGAVYATRGQS